jgi:hypothetical protein
MMITKAKQTRRRYKPEGIKCLFVAEAPPPPESDRFFYYEDVSEHDSLFISMMKALYPEDCVHAFDIRRRKPALLTRFMREGFYLIDASDEPMESTRPSKKKKQLAASLDSLVQKVNSLVTREVPVILIAKPVYEVCYERLVAEGFNIVNRDFIYFPLGNYQDRFIEDVSSLVKQVRASQAH